FIFIIIQPILDLMTALGGESPVSVGALAKSLLMLFLWIYIVHYLWTKKRRLLWLFISTYLAILLMLIVNIVLKSYYNLFAEINFAFKTSYYLTMLYTAIVLIESKVLNKRLIDRAVTINSIIIGVSYWLAIITGTSIESYAYEGVGYAGWFFSANELSVIIILLLGILLARFLEGPAISTWVAFLLLVSMLPMIGTKTAFIGGVLLLIIYTLYLLGKYRLRILQNRNTILFIGVVIIFFCMLPVTPIMSNTAPAETTQIQETAEQTTNVAPFIQKILSSRHLYLQETKDDFMKADILRNAFGLGYAGDYEQEPKIIEMDFFDLFFSYGIIGTVLLFLPLVYVIVKVFPLKLTMANTILLFTLSLCFGVAFLAGHVLFAPAVMTYVAITYIALGLGDKVKLHSLGFSSSH